MQNMLFQGAKISSRNISFQGAKISLCKKKSFHGASLNGSEQLKSLWSAKAKFENKKNIRNKKTFIFLKPFQQLFEVYRLSLAYIPSLFRWVRRLETLESQKPETDTQGAEIMELLEEEGNPDLENPNLKKDYVILDFDIDD